MIISSNSTSTVLSIYFSSILVSCSSLIFLLKFVVDVVELVEVVGNASDFASFSGVGVVLVSIFLVGVVEQCLFGDFWRGILGISE